MTYFGRCAHEGCHTYPTFGETGEAAIVCKKHQLPHHVDVKNSRYKKCVHEGCAKQPQYGECLGGKALSCSEHRSAGSVPVHAHLCCKVGLYFSTTLSVRMMCMLAHAVKMVFILTFTSCMKMACRRRVCVRMGVSGKIDGTMSDRPISAMSHDSQVDETVSDFEPVG